MGMSASQARYLSLTARKSDLEFRGQQINQSRLMLSNQSANLYSSMLTMSVPTPPVETDFMKDVYTFSMGGDNTTLSSYKLSMGKDGYGYDILYSKPATTKQLTASSVSDVQRAITRQASKLPAGQNSIDKSLIKVATKYDDSTFSNLTPNVSRLAKISNSDSSIKGGDSDAKYKVNAKDEDKDYNNGSTTGYTIYNKIHGESTSKATTKPSQNNAVSNSILEKMSINNNTLVYSEEKDGEKKTKDYYNVTAENLAKIFGGTFENSNTYTYTNSILSNVLSGLGDEQKKQITVGTAKDNVSFYINTDDMTFYVVKNNSENDINNNSSLKDNATVYKYDLDTLLGLQNASDVKDINEEDKETGKKVYFCVTGKGIKAKKDYYTFNWDSNTPSNGLLFNTVENPNSWKINDKDLIEIKDNLEEKFGITPNKNVDGDTNTDKNNYQYFRDSSTGDIWQLCTTTSTSGSITESWSLFKPNKTYTFGDKEAQLLDEKDWPTGISHIYKSGGYDCFYVPDETGTGGSYYMVQKDAFTYGSEENVDKNTIDKNGTRFTANNTYKIEGLTACVVSNDDIPSTILDAYDKDNYIVYATYNDKDTDFSDPVKYYVFPKDDDAANAVCSYAYEKSYTGKNELLQARANILVDENGRLSKIDILNQGTYALEYGQEKDEDAYNEAYREYEYKLQKYEQEMSAIDAKTALIQQQDKKLELQLKSIDTEHSAIQTELEALKKVIDTNIKSSFGTFGG